jgi:hypothetical protein
MYIILVKVKKSVIAGKGVFTQQDIAKDGIVWLFKGGYDIRLDNNHYSILSSEEKLYLDKVGYLSPWSGFWVHPPKGDPAEFTNHSLNNNLSVKFDKNISPEPYFYANRNIASGEELTNNYNEFDEITILAKPSWAN